MATSTVPQSFLKRHEFFLRRLHSFTGLVPVGGFLLMHLLVNASLLESPGIYQRNVYQIHALGRLLPLVEWTFIFLPILFHGLLGLVIIAGGMTNTRHYRYGSNYRYVLQRITAIAALVFIIGHVFHLHGWFHFDAWYQNVVGPFGGGQFRPFNAASTLALAFEGWVIPTLYVLGLLAVIFHFANGVWTFGITWGIWLSPDSQLRANGLAAFVGLGLAVLGIGAVVAAMRVDIPAAVETEDAMYRAMTEARLIVPNPRKRTGGRAEAEAARGAEVTAAAPAVGGPAGAEGAR